MERLARKNEFGRSDLTAYNAERLNDNGFSIQYGGVKFLGARAVRFGVEVKAVLEKLLSIGLNTTERTLQRYAKQGLIEKPKTKSAGRGYGKTTDWPEDTPQQFYASWTMRNALKIKPDTILTAKEFTDKKESENPRYRSILSEEFNSLSEEEKKLIDFGMAWRHYYKKASRKE
jgi:hypothetical protein